jgi:hypothetical protein
MARERFTKKNSSAQEKYFSIKLSMKDFALSPEEKAEINSIGKWLENSRETLGHKIFGEPTNRCR